MSDWSDLGLPAVNIQGYGYTVDAGLQRTPFAAAQARQRRQHQKNTRTFTVSVELTQAQLKAATDFLEADGFSEFTIDLLSGQSETEPVSAHTARLIDNYVVSAVGYNLYKVDMVLEVGGRLGPGGGNVMSCLWCMPEGGYTSWDSGETAWVSISESDDHLREFIRPVSLPEERPSIFTFEVNLPPEDQFDDIQLYIRSGAIDVAQVDLTSYERGVWHTVTANLNWALDPSGGISSIYIYNYIGDPTNAIKLRVCASDIGQVCPACIYDTFTEADPNAYVFLGDHTPEIGGPWECYGYASPFSGGVLTNNLPEIINGVAGHGDTGEIPGWSHARVNCVSNISVSAKFLMTLYQQSAPLLSGIALRWSGPIQNQTRSAIQVYLNRAQQDIIGIWLIGGTTPDVGDMTLLGILPYTVSTRPLIQLDVSVSGQIVSWSATNLHTNVPATKIRATDIVKPDFDGATGVGFFMEGAAYPLLFCDEFRAGPL